MRLLLDAHLSPAVARRLRQDGIDAVALADWLDGAYRTAPDDLVLLAARKDGRVLVTFDLHPIPPLLEQWAETGQHHAGVILVDEKTIPQGSIGGLLRVLETVAGQSGEEWTDRVVFLQATELSNNSR